MLEDDVSILNQACKAVISHVTTAPELFEYLIKSELWAIIPRSGKRLMLDERSFILRVP